jgi:poly(3-hydroxybutyrate) depolymerase
MTRTEDSRFRVLAYSGDACPLFARSLWGALTAIVGLAVLSACSSGNSSPADGGAFSTGSVAAGSGSGSGSAAGSGTGGSGTMSTTGASAGATSGAGGGTTGSSASGADQDGGGMPGGEGGLGGSDASAGDAGHVMPSTGCGMPANQALMTYVKYMETVTLPAGTNPLWNNRNYYVWLPAGYDPNRAYTTVFLGPGCGGNGMMVVPVQNASKTNAIIIGLDPDPPAEGRPCFNTESPTTPEVPYFDETLKQVEAKFCVDTSRIFIAGFSSGSWLADTLGCVRAGVIRGQGNAAGELQGGLTCSGQPIAAIMVHDMGDGNNSYQQHFNGGREAIRVRNGCSTTTMPYDPGVAPGGKDLMGKPIQCVQYQGCKPGYPLVWCPTTGYGHNDQVGSGLSSIGWWNFWEMLP